MPLNVAAQGRGCTASAQAKPSSLRPVPRPTSYLSKKACRKFRKCLKGRSPLQQSLALQLVEACVRSCGEPFQGELARSELLGDLAGMGENSSWCPPETRQQVLTLLQEWALTLPSSQFSNAYDNLRARGVVFPARAPPGADGRPNPYPGLTQGMVPGALPPDSALPGSPAPQPGGRPSGGGRLAGGSRLLSPDQAPDKLRADLDVARNTVTLFEEVLDGVGPGDARAVKEDYVADMADQVTAMKGRLGPLIQAASDERVLGDALGLNDDAEKALGRYRDLLAIADAPAGDAGHTVRPSASRPAPPRPLAAAPSAPPPRPAPAPVPDLLSLDDWEPAPAGPGAPVADPFATSAPVPTPGAGTVALSNNPFASPQPHDAAPWPAPAAQPSPARLAPSEAGLSARSHASSAPGGWGTQAPSGEHRHVGQGPSAPPALETPLKPNGAAAQAQQQQQQQPNPFLSDDAFSGWGATAATPASGTRPPSQATPGSELPPAQGFSAHAAAQSSPSANPFSNNPFASPAPAPQQLPGGYPALGQGPYAPVPALSARTPFSQGPPSLGSEASAPPAELASRYPQVPPIDVAQLYPSVAGGGYPSAPPSNRPLTPESGLPDAFQGLLALRAPRETTPPVPKGAPMRRTTPDRPTGQGPSASGSQSEAALSAFDAFDTIATPHK